MGKRGPAPKPAALKRLAGNPGRRPIIDGPTLGGDAPGCPAWLPATAKTEWRYIVPKLKAMGLLEKTDRMALVGYVLNVWMLREALEALEAEDAEMVYETHNGNYQQNPRISVFNKALEQLLRYMKEFGMTPSSRQQFGAAEQEADPLNDFFKRLEAAEKDKRG